MLDREERDPLGIAIATERVKGIISVFFNENPDGHPSAALRHIMTVMQGKFSPHVAMKMILEFRNDQNN